jgi:transposase
MVTVTSGGMQYRDSAHRLLALLREHFSTITLVWADGGYAGRLVTWAKAVPCLTLTVVKRTDDIKGFVVLPRRWVVERTLCAARRPVVSPVEPGGTWREVSGSNGLPEAERLGDKSMPENLAAGSSGQGRRVGWTRVIWRKLDCLKPNLQSMQVPIHRKDC